jgi:hypothetical protein
MEVVRRILHKLCVMMIPFASHSLALLDWEEQRPLITFQEDILFCGCNGKSEEIGIKWFLPHSSGKGFYLFNNSFHYWLP